MFDMLYHSMKGMAFNAVFLTLHFCWQVIVFSKILRWTNCCVLKTCSHNIYKCRGKFGVLSISRDCNKSTETSSHPPSSLLCSTTVLYDELQNVLIKN